jgi:hypothetical protein
VEAKAGALQRVVVVKVQEGQDGGDGGMQERRKIPRL